MTKMGRIDDQTTTIVPARIPPGEPVSSVLSEVVASFLPPPDISIAEFATEKVFFDSPVNGLAPFSFSETPYQRRICEVLSSKLYEGATLVAPSRAGKSALGLPLMHYAARIDPRDMMLIAPTRTAAGIYAKGDFAKYVAANPDFSDMIQKGRSTDALLLKVLKSGMIISIVWPTATNLAGVDRGVIVIMDYDRIKDDVSGEGSVWTQAFARMKLFGKRKKIFAESSPSKLPDKVEPFDPPSPHAAPPFPGIFSHYNAGTRECWYFKCLDGCGEYFEAHPRHLVYPHEGTIADRAEAAHIVCPHCAQKYWHDGTPDGGASKYDLNKSGRWVPDGMSIDKDGNLIGEPLSKSRIPSFWLTGVAAAWQRWDRMVEALLTAQQKFEETGDDGELKNVTNTDFGLPYFPPGIDGGTSVDSLMERAQTNPYSRKIVPKRARYLVTTVDTQARLWEVQTHAFDLEGRMWIIHRKAVWKSKRVKFREQDGAEEPANVSPFTNEEDWDILADYLTDLKFPVEGKDGVFLRPAMIAIDSGGGGGKGEDGKTFSATANAYAFWRKLRDRETGIHNRIRLLKGEPKVDAPIIEMKMQGLTGLKDVPVYMIGSTRSKDIFNALLTRFEDGPGFVYLPSHENRRWFTQLLSEAKIGDRWEKIRARNESWDLCVYAQAVIRLPQFQGDTLASRAVGDLPDFALEIERNPHAVRLAGNGAEAVPIFQPPADEREMSLEELAEALNG